MVARYWSQTLAHRLSRRRALTLSGGAAVGGALLLACGKGGGKSSSGGGGSSLIAQAMDESKQAKRGGTWLDSQTADFQSWDPHFTSLPHPSRFAFSTLMRIKPGYMEPAKGDYMLDGADSYELSPDKLQLTMKLRPNHTWHNIAPVNGRQVDAQDVVFSYDRLIKTGSNRSSFAGSLGGPIDSLTALDSKTITIKLNKVYAGILALLAGGGSGNLLLLPKEAESQYDPRRTGIGSGPWYVGDYQPSVGTTWKRHEGWYNKDILYADQVNSPIVSEYATGLAQFNKGSIYRFAVTAEDILSTKRNNQALSLYQNDVEGPGQTIFFGWNPALGDKTPFRDQRLRQALSMAIDRDLWIDTFFNVDKFRNEGLAVKTAWHSAIPLTNSGWWLDPQGKDFGQNSKYYKHDPAEAKKLITAAGFPNGVDIEAHYITSSNYGLDFPKRVEAILGFVRDVGMRMTTIPADFGTDWVPKYQDAQGDFPGVSFRSLASGNPDVCEKAMQVFTPGGSVLYTGFFSPDSSFRQGDPRMTELLNKTRAEFETSKRQALINEFQQMAAESQYVTYFPGGASTFTIAWPVLRNQNVLHGEVVPYTGQWLDPAKPPLGNG